MPILTFEEMKEFVDFRPDDAARVQSLGETAGPLIRGTVDAFYDVILRHPGARAVLSSPNRVEGLRKSLTRWLESLFCGEYGEEYVRSRTEIGRAHVRVGLPQHYMITGMEIIWQNLQRGFRDMRPESCEVGLASLHKLLTLELGIMLETYREGYSARVRDTEREAVREQLSHAEHLAHIGQLAASLAHEIKNPLAGISGAIQVIRDDMAADNPHRPILAEVLRQISRLDGTVKDLLVYARPRAPRFAACYLDRVIPRVLTVLREEPDMQRVRVDADVPPGPLVFQADESQIEQVLINLIQNAVHASRDGSCVRVRAAPDGDFLRLVVEDEGEGMNAETCNRAFEPFFTMKSRGTGLGLSIVKKIVEAHDGEVSVSSVLGKGTIVSIRLPRAARAATRASKEG